MERVRVKGMDNVHMIDSRERVDHSSQAKNTVNFPTLTSMGIISSSDVWFSAPLGIQYTVLHIIFINKPISRFHFYYYISAILGRFGVQIPYLYPHHWMGMGTLQ